MSTKIYDAYKILGKTQIWELLKEFKTQAEANVRQKLREAYWKGVKEMNPHDEDYIKEFELRNADTNEALFRLHRAHEDFWKKAKEQAPKQTRDYYDLDVSIAVHRYKDTFYLRLFCDHASCLAGSLDFIKTHPRIVDYHYQNSTDRPENVSAKDWNQRRRIWDKISKEDNGILKTLVVVDICSWRDMWIYGPYMDMFREYRKEPPELPCRERILADKLVETQAFETVEAAPGSIVASPEVWVKKTGPTTWEALRRGESKTFPELEAAFVWVWMAYLPAYIRAFYERIEKERKFLCASTDVDGMTPVEKGARCSAQR